MEIEKCKDGLVHYTKRDGKERKHQNINNKESIEGIRNEKNRKIRKVRKKTKFYSNKKQIWEITNTFKEELELRKIARKKIIEIERSKPEIKQRRQMIKY